MLNQQLTVNAANAAANAACGLCDGSWLRIYSGEQPETPKTPLTTQRQLVELRFGLPAFGLAEDGVAVAREIEPGMATDSGEPTWFRTLAFDGSAGRKGANLNLSDSWIAAGRMVEVVSLKYTQKRN